jgi:patatin-like phospholipase/acyl hydrolase
LDGGGARGITAISSSMSSIVDALGDIEVCDAFDMIVGTSTGAIIGLRFSY